jgi:hypothetical protein
VWEGETGRLVTTATIHTWPVDHMAIYESEESHRHSVVSAGEGRRHLKG